MKNGNRISASAVRKALPGLRRINTVEGRKWTVTGSDRFDTLADVVDAYFGEKKNTEETTEPVKEEEHAG